MRLSVMSAPKRLLILMLVSMNALAVAVPTFSFAGSKKARLKAAIKNEFLSRVAPASLIVVRGSRTSNKVALTFDDGPDDKTKLYINLLDQLNVRATFFLLGSNISKHPELAQALADHGHEVAGHGYTHKTFTKISPAELQRELVDTRDLLEQIVGASPKLVRPPHGGINARTLVQTKLNGLTTILWNVKPDDATLEGCNALLEQSRIMIPNQGIRGGDIILLHEGQDRTLQALPELVKNIRAKGLEFVTVSEL